jgi:predicted neuraminidase
MLRQILVCFFTTCLIFCSSTNSFGQGSNAYLNPPQLIENPGQNENYTAQSRKFTGISSLAVTATGRMWAVWYTGITPSEDHNNYVAVSTSSDGGESWTEVLAIDPDGPGPVRAFDPEVWIDPNGKLWIFWAQQVRPPKSTPSGVWAITADDAESENPKWTDPKRLADGIMMCKPVALSTGEWVLPSSYWHVTEESATMVVSVDQGETWQVRGAASVPEPIRNIDEHMIVERNDGSLWMLVRIRGGIGESVSFDRGYTWSTVVPSRIQHPNSRLFIHRLHSGNLLLVKHGPVSIKTGRSHLMAFVSKDDGRTWSNGLLLDERPGVSYPDGQQASDGTIYITYDYDRRGAQNILFTSFTEDDISIGTDNSRWKGYNNRKVISKGGE